MDFIYSPSDWSALIPVPNPLLLNDIAIIFEICEGEINFFSKYMSFKQYVLNQK